MCYIEVKNTLWNRIKFFFLVKRQEKQQEEFKRQQDKEKIPTLIVCMVDKKPYGILRSLSWCKSHRESEFMFDLFGKPRLYRSIAGTMNFWYLFGEAKPFSSCVIEHMGKNYENHEFITIDGMEFMDEPEQLKIDEDYTFLATKTEREI